MSESLIDSMLQRFFPESLINAGAYSIDTPKVSIKLDQNESPYDLLADLKQKICARLTAEQWNRYPDAHASRVGELIAEYSGVSADSVLTGAGSNYVISLLLDTFTRRIAGKVIVARPSFMQYESHLMYSGQEYTAWELDEHLDYDLDKFPECPAGSLVIFASPNNPVGNVLELAQLEILLSENPDSMFIADEAYFEYADFVYTDLLKRFSNVIIVRTFSKTMNAAGIRLGYALGHPDIIKHLRKVRLPYILNRFTRGRSNDLARRARGTEIYQR